MNGPDFWKRIQTILILLPVCFLTIAFCLRTDSQGNFRKYRSADLPFVYQIHTSTPPEWVAAIDAGAKVWDDIPASYFKFENGGFTNAGSVGRDGVNLIFFDRQGVNFGAPGSNTIAFSATFTAGSGDNFRAGESDYIFNARDFPPALNGEFGQQDLQGVTSHELGHHMGIMHTGPSGNGGQRGCGPSFGSATMFAFSAAGDTTSRSLHFDDKAGAAYLYPSWILTGTVVDAASGAPLPDAALVGNDRFAASLIGPVEFSGAWNQIPGAAGEVPINNDGSYVAASLLQSYDLEARLYGYQAQPAQIAFGAPGGIGETETIVQDFQLSISPQVELFGRIVDAASGEPVAADIEIFAVSEKPGVPLEPVAVLSAGNNGQFNAIVPAREDYRIDVVPMTSPYPLTSHIIPNIPNSGQQVTLPISPADIMLVDDDAGSDYEKYFQPALGNMTRSFHAWNVADAGVPRVSDIEKYPARTIIWFTGDGESITLSEDEQAFLLNHINNRGKLFLTGQNIVEQLTGSALLNRLGISFSENVAIPIILGVQNDIADGILLTSAGSAGANNQTSRDQLTIEDPAVARTIMTYSTNPAKTAAAAIELNSSRAVVFGFGWEAIGNNTAREGILDVVLTYLDATVTGIEDAAASSAVPHVFELQQNYPNPFNPVTTIRYAIQVKVKVVISIHNTLGQKIKTLISEEKEAGSHEVKWDARNDHGNKVASGIYFYRINAGNSYRAVKKMIFIE